MTRTFVKEVPTDDVLDKQPLKLGVVGRIREAVRATEARPPITKLLIDYSSERTVTEIKKYGYPGVIRYNSPNWANPKNLQPAERDKLLAAGLTINIVWESSASRTLGGFAAGKADALMNNERCAHLRAPSWLPTFFAVDFEPTLAQINGPVREYLRAVKLYSLYPVGVYGNFNVCVMAWAESIKWLWQCEAWSYGKRFAGACLRQKHASPFYGMPRTDENVVQLEFPKWGQQPVVVPEVKPFAQKIRWYAPA